MDVRAETITLVCRDDARVATLLFRPVGEGPFPGIAIGAEGTGINRFILGVGTSLAKEGYVVAVPDYYRGAGPADPEALDDIEGLMACINALDFRRATHDLLDAVGHLRHLPYVDHGRIATWGYCTGATLALLAAELDPRVAASVCFYPSQPTFDVLDDRRPVHPIDLLWNLHGPLMLLVGDQDVVLTPDALAEVRRRLDVWNVDHRIAIYPGAGHAFCTEDPMFFHEEAARHGWSDALDFLEERLAPTLERHHLP